MWAEIWSSWRVIVAVELIRLADWCLPADTPGRLDLVRAGIRICADEEGRMEELMNRKRR